MSYIGKILPVFFILTSSFNLYAKARTENYNSVTARIESIETTESKKVVQIFRDATTITPAEGYTILRTGDVLQSSNAKVVIRSRDFTITVLPHKTLIFFDHILDASEEFKSIELECTLNLGELEISFFPKNYEGRLIVETSNNKLVLKHAKIVINEKGFLKESSGMYEVYDKARDSWSDKRFNISTLKGSKNSPVRRESRKELPQKNQILAILETDRIPREELV